MKSFDFNTIITDLTDPYQTNPNSVIIGDILPSIDKTNQDITNNNISSPIMSDLILSQFSENIEVKPIEMSDSEFAHLVKNPENLQPLVKPTRQQTPTIIDKTLQVTNTKNVPNLLGRLIMLFITSFGVYKLITHFTKPKPNTRRYAK